MKSLKQLLRQPLKSLAGVLVIGLAVAILCICLGQSIAAGKTKQMMEVHFTTVALPTLSYYTYEDKPVAVNEYIYYTDIAKAIPEAGAVAWLEDVAQNRDDLIKTVISPGLASAYIPALTQDNLTNHAFFPLTLGDENRMARFMVPTPVYAGAMLEIILEEVDPPVPEDFTPGVGGIVELRGRVERVLSLEEGFNDPVGKHVNLYYELPSLESWETLGLNPGDRCLVYSGEYVDGNWALCNYISTYMEAPLRNRGYLDEIEVKSLDESKLHFYTEEERARLDTNPWTKDVVAQYICTIDGFSESFQFHKNEINLWNAVNLTLVDKTMFGAGEKYHVPTIAKLEGSVEDFLASEEGRLWQEQLELLEVNHKAFPVVGVDRLGYIADFAQKTAGIIEGRDFTDKELESGAKVCVISEQSALLSGLTVGDTIDMRFYNYDENSPYQAKIEDGIGAVNPTAYTYTRHTPFAGEAEAYEIVGIYRQQNAWRDVADNIYSFTPNTVFTPKNSVPSDMAYGNQCFFRTVVLENGAIDDFRTLAAGAGYPMLFRFYDGGYTDISQGLFNYQEASQRAAQIGIVVYGILLALFLLLFPGGQQKTLATMRGLGAGQRRGIAQVVVSCAGLLVPGTVIGITTGCLLWKRATQVFSKDAAIAASMDLDLGMLVIIAVAQLAVALVLTVLLAIPLTRDPGISKQSHRSIRQCTSKQFRRTPLQVLGVFLFAAILSAALCYLRIASEAEVERYHETYQKVPVTVSITDLSGTIDNALNIDNRSVNAFLEETKLGKYFTDIQMVVQHNAALAQTRAEKEEEAHMTEEEKIAAEIKRTCVLIGAHSTELLPELWEESDCVINWKEGYDESIFSREEKICLVPEGMQTQRSSITGEEIIVLEFEDSNGNLQSSFQTDKKKTTQFQLTVVGTYTGNSKAIYCPFYAGQLLFQILNEPLRCQVAHGVLKDNNNLETLRSVSKQWFAEPNPLGEETTWTDGNITGTYSYALRINDYLLKQAAATMENSIAINRLCAVLVLCLSAGAGFLIGFLTVRSRKREIALMRTLGKSNGRIYLGFALEQMLCVALGVAIGGAYGLWDPADQLGILAGVYFVGLTLALVIFLHTNLLSSIKEDE